jgi:hypothetical protein
MCNASSWKGTKWARSITDITMAIIDTMATLTQGPEQVTTMIT